MLNTLRKNTAGWVAKIFIGMLAFSFAIWGIADIFGGYSQRNVAQVGDQKISIEAYRRAYQRQLQALSARLGRTLSTQEARAFGITTGVLNRLVAEASISKHSSILGLGVTDKAIADNIYRDAAFQDSSGKFSRIIFDQRIRNAGLNEQSYVISQRGAAIREQVTATFVDDLPVPRALLSSFDRYQNEKRSLRFFNLPLSEAGDIKKPDEKELKKYYEAHKQVFTAPEYRKLAVLVLRPEDLKANIEISEDDVKAAYESRKDSFTIPERRHIQQISFPDLKTAEKAHKELQSGKSFLDIAKSRDFSESDIDLGTITKKELADQKIAETAFALKKDKFSNPVKGTLATVILRVTKIEPGAVTTYDQAKKDLRDSLAIEKAQNEVLDIQDSVEDSRASGATLEEVSKKLNIKFVEIDAVDKEGKDREGKKINKLSELTAILRTAFASDVGVENDPIEISKGGVAWVDVIDVIQAKLKPFDTVKNDVTEAWRGKEQRLALANMARGLVERARKGETLEDLAKPFKAKVQTSKAVKRSENAEGVPASAIAQAFALPKDGIGSAAHQDKKGRIVFKVVKIERPADLTTKTADEIKQRVRPTLANDFLAQYIAGLQKTYGVNVNQRALETAMGQARGL